MIHSQFKHLNVASFFVALSVLAGVGVWSVLPDARAAEPAVAEPAHAGPSLHTLMEEINSNFRKLRRQVRDEAKNADTLTLVVAMQQNTLQAKALTPNLAHMPDADPVAMGKAYRLRMVRLLEAMLQVEAALLENRNADAYELVKTLQTMKTEGHDEFMKDG